MLGFDDELKTKLVPKTWMNVKLLRQFTEDFRYSVSLLVDDKLVGQVYEDEPKLYENQRVYATTTNSNSQDAIIDQLFINGKSVFEGRSTHFFHN